MHILFYRCYRVNFYLTNMYTYSLHFDSVSTLLCSKVLRYIIRSRRDETGINSRLGVETRDMSRTGMGIETSRDFRESRTFRDVSSFSRFFAFESETSIYLKIYLNIHRYR